MTSTAPLPAPQDSHEPPVGPQEPGELSPLDGIPGDPGELGAREQLRWFSTLWVMAAAVHFTDSNPLSVLPVLALGLPVLLFPTSMPAFGLFVAVAGVTGASTKRTRSPSRRSTSAGAAARGRSACPRGRRRTHRRPFRCWNCGAWWGTGGRRALRTSASTTCAAGCRTRWPTRRSPRGTARTSAAGEPRPRPDRHSEALGLATPGGVGRTWGSNNPSPARRCGERTSEHRWSRPGSIAIPYSGHKRPFGRIAMVAARAQPGRRPSDRAQRNLNRSSTAGGCLRVVRGPPSSPWFSARRRACWSSTTTSASERS
jgi:hypothetical protein